MAKKNSQLQWERYDEDECLTEEWKVIGIDEVDLWFAEGRKTHAIFFPSDDSLRSWKAIDFFGLSFQILMSFKTESEQLKKHHCETIYLKSAERSFHFVYMLPQPKLVATAIKLLQYTDKLTSDDLLAEADAYCGYCLGLMKSDIQERQIKTGNAQKKRGKHLAADNKKRTWKPTKQLLTDLLKEAAKRSTSPTEAIKSIKRPNSGSQSKPPKCWAYNTVNKLIKSLEIQETDWWKKS